MKQVALCFVVSSLVFGSYAAWSAFMFSWRFDVSLLGFAWYGTVFGLFGAFVSAITQLILKKFHGNLWLVALASGIVCVGAASLATWLFDFNALTPTWRLLVLRIATGLFFGLLAAISGKLVPNYSLKRTAAGRLK